MVEINPYTGKPLPGVTPVGVAFYRRAGYFGPVTSQTVRASDLEGAVFRPIQKPIRQIYQQPVKDDSAMGMIRAVAGVPKLAELNKKKKLNSNSVRLLIW